MHEMSIAMNIVDIACKEAQSEGASTISIIELDVGKLAGVMIDSLKFCYDSVCKNTLAEGSELVINEISGSGHCLDCATEFEIDSFMALCPNCESYKVDINQGRELRLKAVTVN
ncbi:hydrogenase maturation nickel metallochaperone HypA [bacterium]|nr:hydrogenase maturation nickel metallochaperone HypA [bacterium]